MSTNSPCDLKGFITFQIPITLELFQKWSHREALSIHIFTHILKALIALSSSPRKCLKEFDQT